VFVFFIIFSGHATNGYDEAANARNATWYASNGYEATYAWYAAAAWYFLIFFQIFNFNLKDLVS
jgi:hypothetical protein